MDHEDIETRLAGLAEDAHVSRRSRKNGRSKVMIRYVKAIFLLLAVVLAVLTFTWDHFARDDIVQSMDASAVDSVMKNELVAPRYDSVDAQGQAYTVTAKRAVRGDDEAVTLDQPTGDIHLDTGRLLSARAAEGVYDQGSKTLILKDGVELYDSGGYRLLTEGVTIDLGHNIARTDQPVRGQGPAGEIEADGVTFDLDGAVLNFSGRVRMRIYPDHIDESVGRLK